MRYEIGRHDAVMYVWQTQKHNIFVCLTPAKEVLRLQQSHWKDSSLVFATLYYKNTMHTIRFSANAQQNQQNQQNVYLKLKEENLKSE